MRRIIFIPITSLLILIGIALVFLSAFLFAIFGGGTSLTSTAVEITPRQDCNSVILDLEDLSVTAVSTLEFFGVGSQYVEISVVPEREITAAFIVPANLDLVLLGKSSCITNITADSESTQLIGEGLPALQVESMPEVVSTDTGDPAILGLPSTKPMSLVIGSSGAQTILIAGTINFPQIQTFALVSVVAGGIFALGGIFIGWRTLIKSRSVAARGSHLGKHEKDSKSP